MNNEPGESVGYWLGVLIAVAAIGTLLGMVAVGLVRLVQWVLA